MIHHRDVFHGEESLKISLSLQGQTIYDNFDRISTYLDDDPLESVLANTVIHHDSDGNQSTLAYFTSEGVTRGPAVTDMMLNVGNDTDEGKVFIRSIPRL